MIAPANNAPCQNCERNIGVKQPDGTEQSEYLYCDAYKRIPDKIASGQEKCNKQVKFEE